MSQPWHGCLEPDLDASLIEGKPADPEMRESASIWLFEENGAFAFPRLGIEAVGAQWERHRYDGNFVFPGGADLLHFTPDAFLTAHGRPIPIRPAAACWGQAGWPCAASNRSAAGG